MDVSCHRPFLPGTSLEPALIPTAQASSFTLQYFRYCVSDTEMGPDAPIITGIPSAFIFHNAKFLL